MRSASWSRYWFSVLLSARWSVLSWRSTVRRRSRADDSSCCVSRRVCENAIECQSGAGKGKVRAETRLGRELVLVGESEAFLRL